MRTLAVLVLLAFFFALPTVAQTPVPYDIRCRTPEHCTATPTVIYDNRPTLADALGELQRQLQQQELARLEAERIRAATAASNRIAALPAPASPVPQPAAFTNGWANGRLWAAMDETNRLIYLMAICEGTWRTEGMPERCAPANRMAMMTRINDFYAVPAYSPLPIASAQWFFVHEKTPEEVAKYAHDYLVSIQTAQPTASTSR